MTIGTLPTLAGLINAMVGGTILVIPILAMNSGYLDWILGCLIICSISCYTAYLLVHHLGKAKNIKYLILNHFNQNTCYTVAYNIVIWFSFATAMIAYFKLFCVMLVGLFGQYPLLPQTLFVVLVFWSAGLRNYDLSEIILASGLCTIGIYLGYLTWIIDTAPDGNRTVPAHVNNSSSLMLTLLNSYTVHDFMIQMITVNPTRKDYPKIVLLLYFFGNLIFMYIAFSSFGLLNHEQGKRDAQTIVQFLGNTATPTASWQLNLIEGLYILHILSSFPQYVLISKIRVFQLANIQHDPQQKITISQFIYTIFVVGVCYGIQKSQIPLTIILDISGALLGYTFAILIPIFIHLKCVHYDKSSGHIQGQDERNLQIISNKCECNLTYRSHVTLWLQTFVLIFIIIYGAIFFFGALSQQINDYIHKG